MSDSTSEVPNTTTIIAAPPFSFQPPTGGDIDLKACDGTIFHVHSILLGLASTVFGGMLSGATKADTVELAEDAETISLMLAFIYPVAPPAITTTDLLEKVMAVAQKYDIERMIKFVEKNVNSGSELVRLDPIRVFSSATQHRFPTAQVHAAKALRPGHCNLLSVEGLLKLAKSFPESSSVIGLVGAQGARVQLLDKLLVQQPINSKIYPECDASHKSNPSAYTYYMICADCWSKACRSKGSNSTRYTPGWLRVWALVACETLLKKTFIQSSELFTTVSLVAIQSTGLRDGGCLPCIAHTLTLRSVFDCWAKSTKKIIEEELGKLDVLYAL